jgi:hypothetical protein
MMTGKNFFIAIASRGFKIIIMYSNKLRQQNKQSGQVFLEFILILALLMTISFSFMKGFRTLIGNRWELLVSIVAYPERKSNINIP